MSLIASKEIDRSDQVETDLKDREGLETVFKPYHFKMEELDGFKYRAQDAWRSVTRIAVREARLKEIRQEILNSTKLQAHLSDHAKDASVLRHDKALYTVKHQPQLKHVPDYIVPVSLKKITSQRSRGQKRRHFQGGAGGGSAKRKFEKRQADPLKALVSKGRRNKK